MTREILATCNEWITKHNLPTDRVLDFGSMDVNGTQRVNFPNADYTGIDIEAGKGVDIVCDITSPDVRKLVKAAPLTICCETLEHVPIFWKALENIISLTTKGGYIFLSFPTFGFPYHAYPIDCNRFTMDAVNGWREFFKLELIDHASVTDYAGLPCLIVLMRKS